ncbi:hypothetical protein OG458_42325 (plasmid) [Streptomyces sp. NBC_01281]|uniref:hypothetical protein n=1 Tax=Streptomyces sp. NBC_01281 TaxID=2903811 RepID=UPI002E0E48FE|nr:hypothetical protein OG458_41480 [Streptomyces sp. NBC_01281]WSK66594.1 hypothetical protein OG458_42325 [Streptomyces sp. NBC_01281]
MKHETTINELAGIAGLFSTVDHITVPETDPNTGTTEEVTLPPPLIRRARRRNEDVWVLSPPGIHERIYVADQAPVTVYFKDVDPGRFTGHIPQHQTAPAQQPAPVQYQAAPAQHPAPAAQPAPAAPVTWQQQPAPQPVGYPVQQPAPTAQQPAAPHRPAAPWSPQQQPPA